MRVKGVYFFKMGKSKTNMHEMIDTNREIHLISAQTLTQ